MKFSFEKNIVVLIVYVDDIILIRDNDEILKLKRLLASEFENTDLGLVRYFLGMIVARSKRELFSQSRYILDLLNEQVCLDINQLAFLVLTRNQRKVRRFL